MYFYFFFLIISFFSEAQTEANWQLTLQVQPELTFHKNYRKAESEINWPTPNTGVALTIQKNLNDKLFMEAGVGYISRSIEASPEFDTHLMFPDYAIAAVYHDAEKVTYKTLQFPVSFGYKFPEPDTDKFRFFVKGSYIPSLVLDTRYAVKIGAMGPYKYSYAENYWQSHAILAGGGFDFRLTKKISLTNALSLTVVNFVKTDKYLSSNYENIALKPHNLQLSSGFKIDLN